MKKALVLSGGAVKGAFQVGVLKFLLGVKEERYDIITGVSVGALNGAYLAQFRKSDTILASKNLEELWLKINKQNIYKHWTIPYLGALWNKSIYNSKPLQDLIKDNINLNLIRANNRDVLVGAVNLKTTEYKLFNCYKDNFIEGVMASSAFPGFFCPVEINGELYTDGGVKEITPLKAAIDKGADEVDVIICSPENTTSKFKDKNTIDITYRSLDLMSDEIMRTDVNMAKCYNKLNIGGLTSKRYIKINVYRPKYNLTDNSLDFSQDSIRNMIKIGYDIAFSLG